MTSLCILAWAGSASRAVISSRSPVYRVVRPSGSVDSPNSLVTTVTEPSITSSMTCQLAGSPRYEPISRSPAGVVLNGGTSAPRQPAGSTGRTRRDAPEPPRYSPYSAGNGDGQTTGHIAD